MQKLLFELPDELKLVRDNIRRFVDRELIPLETGIRENAHLSDDVVAGLQEKARSAGLWLVDVPEELGGQAFDLLAMTIFWEEISRTIAVPARDYSIFGPRVGPILLALNEEQRQEYLYPVLSGEKKVCFAQTEPDAGSDPASMLTRAVRDGGDYVVTGTKRFITGAESADFAEVVVATDPSKGARGGISCLLIDLDAPGVTIGPPQNTMMGEKPREIVFDQVRVPARNLVGQEGDGFRVAQGWINHMRVRHGARACGVASRCLDLAAVYAKQRRTFGKPLSERQGIQWMLADAHIKVHATRLMVYHAAARFSRGEDAKTEAYMVKIFGDEMGFEVVDRCMQIHGGIGLTDELPLERFWRDQRSFTITEGATEVLRTVLAERLLRGVA